MRTIPVGSLPKTGSKAARNVDSTVPPKRGGEGVPEHLAHEVKAGSPGCQARAPGQECQEVGRPGEGPQDVGGVGLEAGEKECEDDEAHEGAPIPPPWAPGPPWAGLHASDLGVVRRLPRRNRDLPPRRVRRLSTPGPCPGRPRPGPPPPADPMPRPRPPTGRRFRPGRGPNRGRPRTACGPGFPDSGPAPARRRRRSPRRPSGAASRTGPRRSRPGRAGFLPPGGRGPAGPDGAVFPGRNGRRTPRWASPAPRTGSVGGGRARNGDGRPAGPPRGR